MKRVIVDYIKIPDEILQKLVEKYPLGYKNRDIVTFTNAKGEKVEAVELITEDIIYLVKVSQKLEDIMDDYEIDEEEEDDDFIDDGASEDIEGMDEEEEDDSFADDKED
jgi:DNA-directed RNA polymerase subunit delta